VTIHVRNWEKHQHRDFAKRKSQKWLRLEAAIFDDPKIAELNASEFRAWIKLLTLAARTGNEIPSTANYLRAHLGSNWRAFLAKFVALHIADAQNLATKAPQKATLERGMSAPKPQEIQETRTQEPKSGPPTAALKNVAAAPLGDLVDNVVELDSHRREPQPREQEPGLKPIGDGVQDVMTQLLRARGQSP
jgi:hypothetical protein